MRKILLIIFVLSLTNSINSQTLQERIKGKWHHCDKEMGYIEIAILDTILYRTTKLDRMTLNSPLIYGVRNDSIIINPGYPDISASINVEILNNKSMILSGFTYNDTLFLIQKDVPDFSKEFYCEIEMTPSQYSEYYKSMYESRRVKNRHKCTSPLLTEIKKETIKPVEYFSQEIADFMADTTRISAFSSDIDFKIINKRPNKNKKTEFIDLILKDDSKDALLIIDKNVKCYSDYNHGVEIINDEIINVILEPFDSGCDKICRKRLYIWISLENYEINRIKVNGEMIK